MNAKVLVSRHNGIGDLAMILPFVDSVIKSGADVTLECDVKLNGAWLKAVMPELKTKQIVVHPYTDERKTVDGFDIFIGLNRLPESYDDRVVSGLEKPMSQQVLYWDAFNVSGVQTPDIGELTPAIVIAPNYQRDYDKRKKRTLVFTKSTSPSRTVSISTMVNALENTILEGEVIYNPTYPSREGLLEAIADSRLVVSVDSGAIHMAELTHTSWICLQTTMSGAMRHVSYKYGVDIQSSSKCSPCHAHGGCSSMSCLSNFPKINPPCKSESLKIANVARYFLSGKGVDLGCGANPIAGATIGVDKSGLGTDNVECGDWLAKQKAESFNWVFSSHYLEHEVLWSGILHKSCKILKKGGLIFLYLPDKNAYKDKNGNDPNQEHVNHWDRVSFIEDLKKQKIDEKLDIIFSEDRVTVLDGHVFTGNGNTENPTNVKCEYSFVVVLRKK